MILRFGLLMDLVTSCLLLSQLLSCFTSISSVFYLISLLCSSSEFLCSSCFSLLG
jgi:hypothetical protein